MRNPLLLILNVLRVRRYPLTTEREAQDAISLAFTEAGVAFERERHLGASGIIDFFAAGVAVDVRLYPAEGGRRAIYRQCRRYAAHPDVTSIVLATNIALAAPLLVVPVTIVHLSEAKS